MLSPCRKFLVAVVVVWRDVGYVKFISTFHSPKEVLIYRRQPGKSEKDERPCIEGIKDYNQNMGGTAPGALQSALYGGKEP